MEDRISSLDWSLIRGFLAVAESGSLSAAARLTGMSQPTLGRQVRQLEQVLQQQLFRRQPKGLELTENGMAMLEPARAMRRAMNQIELTAVGRQSGLEGAVRITASELVSLHFLPKIIVKLRESAPGITIDLVPTDSTENLLFREADIAVRMYQPEQLELVARHLGDIRLGLYAARSYLQKAGRPTNAKELLEHQLVGYDKNEEIINGMIKRGWKAKRDWFHLRCDKHSVYWALVQAGGGIGFGQCELAEIDPEIEEVDLDLDLPLMPVWLATHQTLRHTPRIAYVWDALVEGLKPHLL